MKGIKGKILLWLIIGIILFAASTRILPLGASLTPFLFASSETDQTIADRPYRIYFNDAGAAHSGNFWTYVVRDLGVFRYVVMEGYSTTAVKKEEMPIPIRETNGVTQIGFAKGRHTEEMMWVDLP